MLKTQGSTPSFYKLGSVLTSRSCYVRVATRHQAVKNTSSQRFYIRRRLPCPSIYVIKQVSALRICLLKNHQPSNTGSTLTNGYFSRKLKPYFEFSPLCPLYTTRNSLIMSLRSCWLRPPSSSTVCRSRSAHPLLSGVSYTRA